jgi:hypothetical protein
MKYLELKSSSSGSKCLLLGLALLSVFIAYILKEEGCNNTVT